MKISFVIPCYNVENHLVKCLDSILRQPFDDYEVVAVDDGSTDGTAKILSDYCRIDARLRVITKENGGQGSARNLGVQNARGEYVWFVDSDDWLLQFAVPRLARILDKHKPDVLVLNFEYSFDDAPAQPSSLVPSHLTGRLIEPRESADTFSSVSCWNTPPWRLISRREHLAAHDIRFAEGVFYEDHPYAIKLMLTARSAYIDGGVSYAYYQRATSTTKLNDKKAFDFIAIRRMCLALFREFGVYESFAPIVVSYVAPFSFYSAHVAAPFRADFIKRMNSELSLDEAKFVSLHGAWDAQLFVAAARAEDPKLIERRLAWQRLRHRYTWTGLRRFSARAVRRTARATVGRIATAKSWLLRSVAHAGFDPGGRRFLTVGQGVRVEPICIDVRVNQEDRSYVSVGDYSHVGGTYVFERGIGRISIGEKSSIGGGTTLICTQEEGIHIGSRVMLSWGCTISDSNAHSLNPELRANDAYDWKCGADQGRIGAFKDWSHVRSAPIRIENDAWLGFDSVVLKGVTIGRGAVVGARSVITRDVAPYNIVAGNPAKFISLVPRDRWSWQDIVEAFQGIPDKQQMLKDAYLCRDIFDSLQRYRLTEEFSETLREMRERAPKARSIADIGGGSGIMAMAFALEGYDVWLIEPTVGEIVGVASARNLLRRVAEEIDPSVSDRFHIVNEPIENASLTAPVDIAYCRQVVHHFRDPTQCLSKIGDLLSENGLALLLREHIVFDNADLQFFLANHPFHAYTGGEMGYQPADYRQFLASAGFLLEQEYAFADTAINHFPHSKATVESLDERQIAGRPYSFIARKGSLV
ncbi:glycosyltransferase [Niveibacterium sp. SC-1]|uniref:glycosyltransferase n=1 Tax=Niveibacterium sp. SC-1 TaxID=3135646 RepID=UPI00311FB74F